MNYYRAKYSSEEHAAIYCYMYAHNEAEVIEECRREALGRPIKVTLEREEPDYIEVDYDTINPLALY